MRIILQGRWLTASLAQQIAQMAGAGNIRQRNAALWGFEQFAAPVPLAQRTRIRAVANAARADVNFIDHPRPLASFKLAVMDMDSTLITIECIDEIADMQGLKPQVAAITAAAMRGEIAYPESLRRRLALLAGLDVAALERVYQERLRLSPGAESMLAGFKAAGLKTLLVSGGFTFFTGKLKPRLGLDFTHANELATADGKLTGSVIGAVVDAEAKAARLAATCAELGCAAIDAIAIGDGANDLKMMAVAGLSVAYRAKPVVQAQAMTALNHNGLDAMLDFFT